MTPPRIVVTAAVVRRGGEFFVTRRQKGVHLGGFWEFPGGKCEAAESLEQCLRREIEEELNVGLRVGQELFTCSHEYPERIVELHFFECEFEGEPAAVLGQEMRWVPRAELQTLQFPPADDELIELLSRA